MMETDKKMARKAVHSYLNEKKIYMYLLFNHKKTNYQVFFKKLILSNLLYTYIHKQFTTESNNNEMNYETEQFRTKELKERLK